LTDQEGRLDRDSPAQASRGQLVGSVCRYLKRKSLQRAEQRKNETPADRAARVTAAATAWMAAFTFVLAVTSGLTFLILRNQLKEMRDSGTDTHNLAYATRNLADAAIQAERPWVGPFESETGNAAINIQLNQLVKERGGEAIWNSIDVWVHNGGRSPAYLEAAQVGFHFYKQFPQAPEFNCPLRSGPHIRSLIPQARTGFSCVQKGAIAPNGDLYAYVNLEYRDIRTDKRYFAHLCERYDPAKKDFDWCPEYNDSN
jgi:hypothetical protein